MTVYKYLTQTHKITYQLQFVGNKAKGRISKRVSQENQAG